MQLAEKLDTAVTPLSNLRFLEYSIPCENVLQTIGFFQELGFTSLTTNDVHTYPYAVITDGRCFLGLHDRSHFEQLSREPRFSFVHGEIAKTVRFLNDNNYNVIASHIDEDSFQQTVFQGANKAVINILAARSFSPPDKESCKDSLLGYFCGIVNPTNSVDMTTKFCEKLELLVIPSLNGDYVSVSANRFNMLVVENSHYRLPGLLFEHPQPETLFPLFAKLGLTLEVSEQHMLLDSEYRLKTPDGLFIWIKRQE